jgi:hypothetical protein
MFCSIEYEVLAPSDRYLTKGLNTVKLEVFEAIELDNLSILSYCKGSFKEIRLTVS